MTHQVGRFWWEGTLCKKKVWTLEKIQNYFSNERLKTILLPIITKKEGHVSLRALDWLVTNYAKKIPVIYNVQPPDCPEMVVNIYRSYKTWLWNHKRKNFDPFRRGQRIFFTLDDDTYESTVGQLNFFFWASRYGVLDYAQRHIREIEKDQALSTRHHQQEQKRSAASTADGDDDGDGDDDDDGDGDDDAPVPGPPLKKKRRQLSQAPRQTVFVYPTQIKVVFNPELK